MASAVSSVQQVVCASRAGVPRQRAQARAAAIPSRSSDFASGAELKALRTDVVARSGAVAASRAASLRVFAGAEDRQVVLAAAPPKPAWKGAALKVRGAFSSPTRVPGRVSR